MAADRRAPDSAYARRPRPARGQVRKLVEPRCGDAPSVNGDGCGRMLARMITPPAHIDCPRCKRSNIWRS